VHAFWQPRWHALWAQPAAIRITIESMIRITAIITCGMTMRSSFTTNGPMNITTMKIGIFANFLPISKKTIGLGGTAMVDRDYRGDEMGEHKLAHFIAHIARSTKKDV
jgi:hypothetical protein